jgi:hypothetical protein
MSSAATALAVPAGIVLSSIPLRASSEVLGRKLKQRLVDLVLPALAPHASTNIPRGAYFRQLFTAGFQLPRR